MAVHVHSTQDAKNNLTDYYEQPLDDVKRPLRTRVHRLQVGHTRVANVHPSAVQYVVVLFWDTS